MASAVRLGKVGGLKQGWFLDFNIFEILMVENKNKKLSPLCIIICWPGICHLRHQVKRDSDKLSRATKEIQSKWEICILAFTPESSSVW